VAELVEAVAAIGRAPAGATAMLSAQPALPRTAMLAATPPPAMPRTTVLPPAAKPPRPEPASQQSLGGVQIAARKAVPRGSARLPPSRGRRALLFGGATAVLAGGAA